MLPTSLNQQMGMFLRAILLGAALAAGFDLLEGFRRACRLGRGGTALMDALFCLSGLGAFLLFFLRSTDGRLRGYLPLGLALGAFLEQKALSRLLRRSCTWLLQGLFRLLKRGRDGLFWLFSFPRGQ